MRVATLALPAAFRIPARGRRSPEEANLWIGGMALLAILWLSILTVGQQRAELERQSRAALAASTAKGFAEYVTLQLADVDRLLLATRERFMRTGQVPSQAQLTAELGPIAPLLVQVSFSDAQGRMVASSLPLAPGVSVADRPHFIAFRDDRRDRAYLSQPVMGRVSRKVSLQLVRPLLGPAGEFRGIAVASLDPMRLQHYFGSLDAFANGGTVLIAGREDGIVRTRFSEGRIDWGQSLAGSRYWAQLSHDPAGRYATRSIISGELRQIGFHEVEDYPLVVLVATRQPAWLTKEMALALALGAAFTVIQLRYLRSRVRRVREKERLIERLRNSRRREMEANRMKSRFIASVSHELRTPLNAILGFSELMRDLPDHPDNARRAGLIHNSGKHLHALLNTLLDLAKIEAGRMSVEHAEVDLAETVRTVAEIHGASAQRKGLELAGDCEIPDGWRAVADTDGTKLVQVLNNVLHNAVKFTSAGRITVNARLEDGAFVIQVVDTGRGIAPEQLPHVFDRFSAAAAPGSDHEEGSGLGLALSHELMRLLGGSIVLASRVGTGTQVTIRLPGARLAEIQP